MIVAVLVPRQYDVRLFDVPREAIEYGKTAWIGTAAIAVDELGQANITGIARVDGKNAANIGPSVLSEVRKTGVKSAYWTKKTAGRKRIVRAIFRENCTAEEFARFRAIKRLETQPEFVKETEP